MKGILKISEAASLAMHTMALLAHEPDRIHSVKGIAESLNVSRNHLSKVLQRLAKAGFVESTRGPKGGFVLSLPAREIALLDVYESIEGKLTVNECLLEKRICNGSDCIFGDLLSDVQNWIKDFLSSRSLDDIKNIF
jgi:Rrf2 family protein